MRRVFGEWQRLCQERDWKTQLATRDNEIKRMDREVWQTEHVLSCSPCCHAIPAVPAVMQSLLSWNPCCHAVPAVMRSLLSCNPCSPCCHAIPAVMQSLQSLLSCNPCCHAVPAVPAVMQSLLSCNPCCHAIPAVIKSETNATLRSLSPVPRLPWWCSIANWSPAPFT